jgi:hypothetical protein
LTIKKNNTIVDREESKSPLVNKMRDDILSDDSGSDINRKDASHSSFMSDNEGQISPAKINDKR